MRDSKISVYLHIVWSTWDRAFIITPESKGRFIAINGTENHVHILVGLAPTISIADLVKQLKGVSSYFANHSFHLEQTFKWAGTYAVFSVSRWDVRNVRGYIARQKEHHAAGTLIGEMEVPREDEKNQAE